ncbi:hypothetical protein ACTVQL_10470 [Serratia marcescens]|uniref:hypothetical protein n=1 Tax=Serratia marcescens TaxID=615 RepID=UPI003FA73FA9
MKKIIAKIIISITLLFAVTSFAVPAPENANQRMRGWGAGQGCCCPSCDCPMQGYRSGGPLSKLLFSDRQEFHQLIAADHFDKSKFEAFFDKHGMKNKEALLEWSYQRYEWFHQLP